VAVVSSLISIASSPTFRGNYGVEIKNREWLQPDYFAVLRSHGVVHVFNNLSRSRRWEKQMAVAGSETSDSTVAARFLLKPGRSYEEAVEQFSPYRSAKEINEEARAAGRKLIAGAKQQGKKAFIYVNNRLEGNALGTISVMTHGKNAMNGCANKRVSQPCSRKSPN
jgi:hypothetical protein